MTIVFLRRYGIILLSSAKMTKMGFGFYCVQKLGTAVLEQSNTLLFSQMTEAVP